ncbi:Eco57I restriction-modification methylase domain-containing protein [Moraxella nasovis]|uniref:Eco57I restriction-modification methylase domain-containing protein n=1 Tax=Moraxella nasovis TaxID=2904121 RepID=UPI001F6150A2|nr:Eco57I restriction-modification methylase domain-containing protein [Moraxella nasovis]UNU74251.1 Eco57I restriction-modification methylase domain-containing protein [Moraxella nasovis]
MSDLINYNPDVLECLANLSNDEVFTPPKLVNEILDRLPQALFENPNTTFLDPVCKSGVFLREITKRLIKGLEHQIPDLQERLNHIFSQQLYGIAITHLTALLSRRSVYCAKRAGGEYSICTAFDDNDGNIFFPQSEHTWQNGKCTACGASQDVYDKSNGSISREHEFETHAYAFIHPSFYELEISKMKFDVIIGNPPYQLSDGGASASATPIYHKFIQQAKKLNPHYLIMITPSRWFAGGKGLDEFRDEMLNDRRLKVLVDYIDSNDCFPGVDISGGVSYFLWDKSHSGTCLVETIEGNSIVSRMNRYLKEDGTETFIRFNQAISILRKIKNFKEKSFSNLVSSRKPFGFSTSYRGQSKSNSNSVELYTSDGINYISLNDIDRNRNWVNQYKVYIARAYGERISSNFWVLGKPFLGKPNTACTETYLVIGTFENEQICKNVMSYISTRFFRFLVLLKKNTQDGTQKVYQFVPMQDFSKSWTDDELYQKYGLSDDEIAFIEKMVRPMELENE